MRGMNGRGRRVTIQNHLVDFVERERVKRNIVNFNLAVNMLLSDLSCHGDKALNDSVLKVSPPDSHTSVNEVSFLTDALDALG